MEKLKQLGICLMVELKLTMQYCSYIFIFYLIYKVFPDIFKIDLIIRADIIPGLRINQILLIESIGILLLIICSCFFHVIQEVIVTNALLMKIYVTVQLIILVLKNAKSLQCIWGAILVIVIYSLLEFLNLSDLKAEKLNGKSEIEEKDIYSDAPIMNKQLLSTHLQEQVSQILKVIDNHTYKEPFTLALQGEWGSGKTSVLFSLEQELLERNVRGKRYFVLKIDTLLFQYNKDIIAYVNQYFEALFFRYNVKVIKGISRDNYLELIMRLLGEDETVNKVLSNVLGYNTRFSDVHKERAVFEDRIDKLLRNSDRKKIIILVDDTDRNGDDEKRILSFLEEVFGVRGIFTIVLRKKGVDDEKEIELDKFINMKIEINKNDDNIESDRQINQLIQVGCKRYIEGIKDRNPLLMYCYFDEVTKYFNFSFNTSSIIQMDGQENGDSRGREILFDTFLIDIINNRENIGIRLESIIMEYFRNIDVIKQVVDNIGDNEDIVAQMLKSSHEIYWGEQTYLPEEFNWMNKLIQFTDQPLLFLPQIIETIEKGDATGCITLEEIYERWEQSIGIKSIRLPDGEKMQNYQLLYAFEVMFTNEEKMEITSYIQQGNYSGTLPILHKKMNEVVKRKVTIVLLQEMLFQLRKEMNVPRTLKILIRESNLYEVNLVQYIMSKIDFKKKIKDVFEKYGIQCESYEGKELAWFLQKAFYYHYIYKKILDRANETGNKMVVLYFLNENYYLVYYEFNEDRNDTELVINVRIIPIVNNTNVTVDEEIAKQIYSVVSKNQRIKDKIIISIRDIDTKESFLVKGKK